MHARAPTDITTEALQRIGELYAIEAEVRGCSAEQRLAARKARAAPMAGGKSKATSLRGVAAARKHWLFAGSDSGGEYAAVLYSLIGICRLNNVEPEKWLRYVIEHIQDWPANRGRDLLPWKSCPDLSVNIRRAAYPVSYLRQRLRYLLRSRYLFY